jgi:CRISPR system Cascade subunit CasE
MYLSRLILNPRARRAQRELANPYELHRTLMRAFADDLKKGDERVLFRQEPGRNGTPTLLVQSWTRPDWSYLAGPEFRGYLLPVGEPNPAVKSFDLDLAADRVLAFRLRANPTVKRRFSEKDHKRVGIYDEQEQFAWLKRKGELGGFRIISARSGGQEDVGGKIKRDKETHALKLAAVQFDGLLQVTDPQRLREAVRRGVGSGKGLGFGLLSLAPPRN